MNRQETTSNDHGLPEGVTPVMVLEEMALIVLREAKLTPDDRETLEKAVKVARSLKKLTTPPEVKS